MGNDTTTTKTTSTGAVSAKVAGNTITADSFRQMIDILDNLRDHTHDFTDDYTSNCQCNCGRGSL